MRARSLAGSGRTDAHEEYEIKVGAFGCISGFGSDIGVWGNALQGTTTLVFGYGLFTLLGRIDTHITTRS